MNDGDASWKIDGADRSSSMSCRREFSRSRCVRGRCRDRGQVGDNPKYLLTAAALDFDGTNHTSEETT